jgi:hypothetical protein
VAVGIYMSSSTGPRSSIPSSHGSGFVSIQDSVVSITECNFTNCSVSSVTEASLGTASVYGGAVSILHELQISIFKSTIFEPELLHSGNLSGFNFSVLMSKSHFSNCSVRSSASSGRLAQAHGAGGAVHVYSRALANVKVTQSTFSSNYVAVDALFYAKKNLQSFCYGGALAITFQMFSLTSFASVSSCMFFNNSVTATNSVNSAMRGGAVYMSHIANVSVSSTNFTNCSLLGISRSVNDVGDVISGGASISVAIFRYIFINQCVFDCSGGEDLSKQSVGVLVLFRQNVSFSRLDVSDSLFKSSERVFSVICVEQNFAFAGEFCFGPQILMQNSKLQQLEPKLHEDNFNATGSDLMLLQNTQSNNFYGTIYETGFLNILTLLRNNYAVRLPTVCRFQRTSSHNKELYFVLLQTLPALPYIFSSSCCVARKSLKSRQCRPLLSCIERFQLPICCHTLYDFHQCFERILDKYI